MAPNPKVRAAYRAMAELGISESQVKPVLKNLFKLYDKNWALIEEENYRALADAIFEADEKMVPEPKKIPDQKKNKKIHEEDIEDEEAQLIDPARPLKRLRLRNQESPSSHPPTRSSPSASASPSQLTKLEDGTLPGSCSGQQPQSMALLSDGNARTEACPDSAQGAIVNKGKQPVSPQVAPRRKRIITEAERESQLAASREPIVKPGALLLPSNKVPHNHALIIPKDEPLDELPDYQIPIAVIPPEPSSVKGSEIKRTAGRKQNGHVNIPSSQCRDGSVTVEDIIPSSSVELASSTEGEVKIYLRCSSALGEPGFCMPSQDQILKMLEDKCLQSYKITDPNFSVPKLLKDICNCMLEFKSGSNVDPQEDPVVSSSIDVLKESDANGTLVVRGNKDLDNLYHCSNGSINIVPSTAMFSSQSPVSLTHGSGVIDALLVPKLGVKNLSESVGRKELEDPVSSTSLSLVVVPQHQLIDDDIRSFHDINDLTKGEESVQIPWVNSVTNDFPSPFKYIPQNLVFKDAYVNISLSGIVDGDCCSPCMGNCVLLSTPCACANKTGGEFAYTDQGLLKEGFLEECIAISRNPQQHNFYCKDCPLERSKNDDSLEPCKGHAKRKFIKECWSKCGCGKQCGNRVVQRGITCKLQVFFTSDGKGWGLRTLEELPKGAFVCEYVGEILTIKELHERNMIHAESGKYTYPVLLDADWDTEFVKDEEALCLDAASFGNTARFINHRCFDANLVEIPVEVEGPDHHYYHFAFFTCRKIAALEELTWDYGIDFGDHDHHVKLFQCKCGSKLCRNMTRSNRSLRFSSNAR